MKRGENGGGVAQASVSTLLLLAAILTAFVPFAGPLNPTIAAGASLVLSEKGLSFSAASSGPSAPIVSSAPPAGANFDYVVSIVMENKGICDILTSCGGSAPYLTSLAAASALATSYQGCTFPSLGNYLCITAASTFGCSTDAPPNSTACTRAAWNATNLVDRLVAANLTWKAYQESMPSNCFSGNQYPYAVKHNPFVYYKDIATNASRCARVIPSGTSNQALLNDLNSTATASNYMWLTPNLCHDMHDCNVTAGDNFLASLVPQILNSTVFQTQRATLFITFDEDGGGRGSPNIFTIWAGPAARHGFTSNVAHNHYSALRTIEANWNLTPLNGNDTAAVPMIEFFPGIKQAQIRSILAGDEDARAVRRHEEGVRLDQVPEPGRVPGPLRGDTPLEPRAVHSRFPRPRALRLERRRAITGIEEVGKRGRSERSSVSPAQLHARTAEVEAERYAGNAVGAVPRVVFEPDSGVEQDAIAPLQMRLRVERAALDTLGDVGHAAEPARVRVVQPVHALGAILGPEHRRGPGREVELPAHRRDPPRVVEMRALVVGRRGRIRGVLVFDLSRESRDFPLQRRARTEPPLVRDAPRQDPVRLVVVGIAHLPERAEGAEGRVRGIEEEVERKLLLTLRRERAHAQAFPPDGDREVELPVHPGVGVPRAAAFGREAAERDPRAGRPHGGLPREPLAQGGVLSVFRENAPLRDVGAGRSQDLDHAADGARAVER